MASPRRPPASREGGRSGEAASPDPINYPPTQYYVPSQIPGGAVTTLSATSADAFYQHHHHHQQAPAAGPSYAATGSSDYSLFMSEYGGGRSGRGLAAIAAAETRRAKSQMTHYFDVRQYQAQLDAPPPPSDAPSNSRRPSRKEVREFKRRKQELKKVKNKWLYD